MKKNWKKTLAAAGMGMVLMTTSLTPVTAFAAVDTQNLLTFVNDTMDDGSQVYYFEEVAVTLPADWQGKGSKRSGRKAGTSSVWETLP